MVRGALTSSVFLPADQITYTIPVTLSTSVVPVPPSTSVVPVPPSTSVVPVTLSTPRSLADEGRRRARRTPTTQALERAKRVKRAASGWPSEARPPIARTATAGSRESRGRRAGRGLPPLLCGGGCGHTAVSERAEGFSSAVRWRIQLLWSHYRLRASGPRASSPAVRWRIQLLWSHYRLRASEPRASQSAVRM